MGIEEIFNASKKPKTDKSLLSSLYEQPKKEKGVDIPHLQIFEPNYLHEADLLFMPTDDLNENKTVEKEYYKVVKRESIAGVDKQYFDYISRQFNDSKDKKDYIIKDIVKPTTINKIKGITKNALYFQYYDKNIIPEDDNDYEYTKCDILINLKEVKFKRGKIIVPNIILNQTNTTESTGKYSYILAVVDTHNKHVDAEPLKGKSSKDIEDGFKKIYARKYLDIPDVIGFDSGTEFKNTNIINYFKKLKVRCKFALTNRHRQQALIERQNKTIGLMLTKAQTEKELVTGKTNREWVKNLPILIKLMNENISKKPLVDAIKNEPFSTKASENLIPLNSKVRQKLDYPIDSATGKRTGNIFRAGDIKWGKKEREVKNIILKPGYPPLYQLDGKDGKQHDTENNVAYTKQQLQIIYT